ncbi:MAG: hypothetical protein ABIQ95_13795, partial [Bdellovibrionia bacterium]
MGFRRFFLHVLFVLLLPSLFSCGKNISQILFHIGVDQRSSESLSGALPPPVEIAVADPLKFSFAVFGDIQVHQ